MSAVTPISRAAFHAQLTALSAQGLDPLRTSDLSGDAATRCMDQPVLLINRRADVSALASAACALARRAHSLLKLAAHTEADEDDLHDAVDAAYMMFSEVLAMIEAVAKHPDVMRPTCAPETQS